MQVVYKYTHALIEIDHRFQLPVGAQILTTGVNPANHKEYALWALVNTDEQNTELRQVWMLSTGFDQIANTVELKYINSFRPDPNLIFHSFEVIR